MDPRPILEVDDLVYSSTLEKTRKRRLRARMPIEDKHARRRFEYVINKYRGKQRALLEKFNIEDPDPYVPTYIFFCFQGTYDE
jgi:hypothetical protein